MIDVEQVLQALPRPEGFPSVRRLTELAESLRGDPEFHVEVPGSSRGGLPIHHIRCGSGSLKALFVAGPHCNEPIGGLTVMGLLHALKQRHPQLRAADVEWHIIPCIDPDGALLNEGWTQRPFSLDTYMRHSYLQAPGDQVDASFPIAHKRLMIDRPSCEAAILKQVLDRVRPDFFFSLHNAWTGGAFYFVSRDIQSDARRQLGGLLQRHRFPLQRRPIWREICAEFAPGMVEIFSIRKYYDYLERASPGAEASLRFGAGSWDYLAQIKPRALTFVAEMGYIRHPMDESERDTGENLRQFKLRVDTENQFLASLILAEWDKLRGSLDESSPFYQALRGGVVVPGKENIVGGGPPLSRYPTADVLLNAQYDHSMTEGERFNACMVDGGFMLLPSAYQFVRLLRTSAQTAEVRRATERLEHAFDQALAGIGRHVDFSALEVVDFDTLLKVQLGSGLIALNSLLQG